MLLRRLPGVWFRWADFVSRREPGAALALFRIGCGVCVVWAIGGVAVNGLAPFVWLDPAHGGYRDHAGAPWQFALVGGVNPVTLWTAIGMAVMSGLLLAAGLGGRATAFLTLQAFMALTRIDGQGFDDQMLTNALWLLVLSRSTATLSLDCRLRTGRWTSDMLIPAWPRYLVIHQLVLLYWASGMQKVSVAWTPAGEFSALYYILQRPCWQRWDMSWLAWVYPLTQIGTAVSWLWEVTAPLLLLALWFRRTRERRGRVRAFFNWINFRRLFVMLGVTVHLNIFVFMGLGPFSWVALSFYACLFQPDEWRAFGRRFQSLVPSRFWSRGAGEGRAAPAASTASGGPSSTAVEREKEPWAQVRGVLIPLHLFAITVMALPGPAHLDRSSWKNPRVQLEFSAWAERLSGWGVALTPAELEDRLWITAETYTHVRGVLMRPFLPYYTYCGTRQGWQMFAGPDFHPTRLHIDLEERGQWRNLYLEGDPDHAWQGRRLNHDRFRATLFNIVFYEDHGEYSQFAHWAAAQAAPEFPQATRLRVRLYRYPAPSPEEVRAGRRPAGEFIWTVIVPCR